MNVTLKIDDALCREARHRAVDRGLSLSGWIAELLRKELARRDETGKGLLDSLAMGDDGGFEIPRDSSVGREIRFEP